MILLQLASWLCLLTLAQAYVVKSNLYPQPTSSVASPRHRQRGQPFNFTFAVPYDGFLTLTKDISSSISGDFWSTSSVTGIINSPIEELPIYETLSFDGVPFLPNENPVVFDSSSVPETFALTSKGLAISKFSSVPEATPPPIKNVPVAEACSVITIFPTTEPFTKHLSGAPPHPRANLSSPKTILSVPESPVSESEYLSNLTANMGSADMFATPIDTKPPPSMMKVQTDHPVPRTGVVGKGPLQTNKFYANFILGDQRSPTYTFPYSMAWGGGKGATGSWGMICSHTEASQRVFGKEKAHGASAYFINPVGIESMIISAKELGKDTALTIDSMTAFSARVHLSKDKKAPPAISFPLVQGMAYVTAAFTEATPLLQSGIYFKTVTKVTVDPKRNLSKFTFNLEDGSTWRVYAWKTKGLDLDLQVINNGQAEAKKPFTGIIQIAKDPMTPGSEDELDDGAGIYPMTLKLSGSATDKAGTYTFNYQRDGHGTGNLYMYALPHHVDSFDGDTTDRVMKTKMQSTTKGIASLVKGETWTMKEPNMPISMGFSPWSPEKGSMEDLSDRSKSIIHGAAAKELSQNMISQSNLDSMYFSGKVSHIRIFAEVGNSN